MDLYKQLIEAAECEDIERIESLLFKGAKINFQDQEGNSVLHWAIEAIIDTVVQNNGSPDDIPLETIEYLLKKGANAGALNNLGESPVDWAVGWNALKVTELLKKYGS